MNSSKWLLVFCLSASSFANATDGCLALLCFAAPVVGAEADCKQPVKDVLRDLWKGRPFPVCRGMDGKIDPSNEVKLVNDAPIWDDCPAGTIAAKAGTNIQDGHGHTEISEQSFFNGKTGQTRSFSKKACVSGSFKKIGMSKQQTYKYENVVWLEPHNSRNAVEVYIDGVKKSTTRY